MSGVDRAVAWAAAQHGRGPLAKIAPAWRQHLGTGSLDDGLDGVHPSWLETPAATRPEVARWLLSWRVAELVEMDGFSAPGFQRALEDVGLSRLAIALQATPEAIPRLAAHLGSRGRELIEAAARPAARDDIRAAVRELAGLTGDAPLFAAGARHVAPALAMRSPIEQRRIAQSLPRALGELLLAEAGKALPDASRYRLLAAALR